MDIKIKLLEPTAKVPTYGTDGAACFDFYALYGDTIHPRERLIFRTGVAIEVPEGQVMLLFSRSGHGFKNGVRLSNCVGVIDSDYRGEIMASLSNDAGHSLYDIDTGARIIQGMLVPAPQHSFVIVDELSSTNRGDKGFGSTGK